MQSLIAKLDLASYNFPICNIGSAVYEGPPHSGNSGSRPRPNRAATASLSPILKPHHDPFARVRTPQTSHNSSPSLRKRQIKSQMNQRGQYPNLNNIIKPLDFTQMLTNRNNSIIQSKTSQRTTFNLFNGENPLNKNPSDVKVISMNDQTKFRKSGTLAKPLDREKFDKKYVHFKRTQHRTYLRHIGRFNSLAEITNRADSIIQPVAEIQNNQEEVDKILSQVYVNTRQKAAFLERQTNQMVRLRRKILDGEIVDFQKYYPGMNNGEKIAPPENHIVAGNNFWLPVAGTQSLPVTLESERQPSSPLASNRQKEPEQQPYVRVARGPKLKPYKIERVKNSPYLKNKRTSNVYEGIHQSNSALFISNSRKSVHQANVNLSPNTQAKQEIEINQFKSKECLQSLEGSMIMLKQAGEYNLSRNKGNNQTRMSDPKIFSTDFHLKFHETEESEKSSLLTLPKQKLVPTSYSNVNLPKDRVNPKENALSMGRIDKLFKDKREKGNRKPTDPGIEAWDYSPAIKMK